MRFARCRSRSPSTDNRQPTTREAQLRLYPPREVRRPAIDLDHRHRLDRIAVGADGDHTRYALVILRRGDLIADRFAVQRAGAFDGVRENVECVVAEGGVRVGILAGALAELCGRTLDL